MITISVNNKQTNVDTNVTIQKLLAQLEFPINGIAVAINDEIIPQHTWNTSTLNENDQLLIIQATQGG